MGTNPGILDCFAKPDPQIIAKVGWKRAAGCLLSKSCFHCGKMAAMANPLTMMRICGTCAQSDEHDCLISTSKAKESFLLSEKDCAALPFAKTPLATLLLISDVMKTSYAKYGGANGLAAEFAKRKTAAVSRFEKSQSTNKPQKKHPKIEALSDRPEDNLASLRFFTGTKGLPILTAYMKKNYWPSDEAAQLKMSHPIKCAYCDTQGLVNDIIMHELVEHKITVLLDCDNQLAPCAPFEGTSPEIPSIIQPADELFQLLGGAQVEHKSSFSRHPYEDAGNHKDLTHFTFGECKIAALYESNFIETCSDYNMVIQCELGKNAVPIELVEVRWGEMEEPPKEADAAIFENLMMTLGLEETKPKKLLAALISRAMSRKAFLMAFRDDDPDETEVPVLYDAFVYLSYNQAWFFDEWRGRRHRRR